MGGKSCGKADITWWRNTGVKTAKAGTPPINNTNRRKGEILTHANSGLQPVIRDRPVVAYKAAIKQIGV